MKLGRRQQEQHMEEVDINGRRVFYHSCCVILFIQGIVAWKCSITKSSRNEIQVIHLKAQKRALYDQCMMLK